ncbi:putative zinc-binding metallopeptidase [Prevotella sp. E15-22]|uniref:substrate import-associated zinc metallohydrolase lipoprotein n=1 Tax=Prevotella sp. E15-22 TaxID=2937774 RepID=UPI002050A295|nr:substrate import-associated zinc metallohydrolase lipoprotein [Prevotella sp. E15-22]UPS43612.1 putative zinc-binding metallopeptidase [Prevotella sp. E15-22]
MKKILYFFLAASMGVVMTSCSNDDDFTSTIFDTTTGAVDTTSATAPFDQWLYDNFVVPYNTEIQYKFNLPASSMDYQLTPADYKKSQLLSHFIKYLFYDVYNKYGGDDFMKKYGPRMFHYIGSAAYAPSTGTETLGYASAGVKITLINVNNMKYWTPESPYTDADMDQLNKDQFHVMHHEFSHILHQTKSYPVAFGQVTSGTYQPRDWQKRDSIETHMLGYLTHYGSSATYEDFVETLSCTITDTDYRWMTTIIEACLNGGVKTGDKEAVYELIDSLGIRNFDDPNMVWNKFSIYKESALNEQTGEYDSTRLVPGFHLDEARSKSEVSLKFEKVKDFTSFRDYLDKWVQLDKEDKAAGINAILKKISIAQKWHKEKWGLDLFQLRKEVRERQDKVNDYVKNNVTIYDLK